MQRVAWLNFVHPTQTLLFTKYKFLQVNELSVWKLFQLSNSEFRKKRAGCPKLGHTTLPAVEVVCHDNRLEQVFLLYIIAAAHFQC